MEQFLDSPMMQEFLNDPEKMEQSRQALLNNPMAMQMMQQMPGFEEMREALSAIPIAKLYEISESEVPMV